MSSLLYSIGRWAFRSRKLVLAVWMLLLVALGGGALLFNQGTDNSFSIPGTESQQALDTLSRNFPQVSGTSAQVVVVAPSGSTVRANDIKAPVTDAVTSIGDIHGVAAVTSPYSEQVKDTISSDGSAAVVTVQLTGQQSTVSADTKTALTEAGAALQKTLPAGAQVAVGGQVFSQSLPTISATELIGVGVALVVLILTFGSFIAAGMPLITALLGVLLSVALIYIATLFGPISSTTPLLALMLGLAVGIDYSLFIISRHQSQLKMGVDPEESTARAVATAGSAVLFAGITVIIALLGLSVAGIPFLTTMGVAASVAVAIAVLISLTLTPALVGFAGKRITPGRRAAKRRERAAASVAGDASPAAAASAPPEPSPAASPSQGTSLAHAAKAEIPRGFFRGWVRSVTRYPIVTIVAVVVALGIAAIPAAQLRLALPDAGSHAAGDPARVTYDLVSKHFGPGYNGPLIVTGSIVSSTDPVGLMTKIGDEIAAMPGVAAVPVATPNQTADTGIIQVIPTTAPDSPATAKLVAEIRAKHQHFLDTYHVDLAVTGRDRGADRRVRPARPARSCRSGPRRRPLARPADHRVPLDRRADQGRRSATCCRSGRPSARSRAVFLWGWFAGPLHVARTGPWSASCRSSSWACCSGSPWTTRCSWSRPMREDYVHRRRRRAMR